MKTLKSSARLVLERRRIQSTILMDIFFGLVIVANGVMMGLTTQGVVDESSDEAQIFELVPWSAILPQRKGTFSQLFSTFSMFS